MQVVNRKVLTTLRDPRWIQVFLLTLFLLYAHLFLYTRSGIYSVLTAVLVCLLTQAWWSARLSLAPGGWKSALITALGLCLLLKVNHPGWMAVAAFLSISSKFLIRIRGKHVFNPSNLGIVVIIAAGVGWISPGQWGTGMLPASFIALGATVILFGVNRWDVAIAFLVSLFLLDALRTVWFLGWPWEVTLHKFRSGTLLIFAFFMITDPRTSPDSRTGRIIWGSGLAVLTFLLTRYFYFYQAPIFSLCVLSALTPIIDKYYKHESFQWILKPKNQIV